MDTQKIYHRKERFRNLILSYQDKEGLKKVFISDFFSIGRDSKQNLSLDDSFISSRHCRIEKTKDGFMIRDLRSKNGTFVNGVKVMESDLNHLDQIQIGKSSLKVHENNISSKNILESKNEKWNKVLKKIPSISQSNASVLLSGQSGVGKEILSQNIHEHSSRKFFPFISVNCSALHENLIESELFGHKKGSFTGAISDRKGAFESARGGSLFLDEIGDLALHLQAKLLRSLENQEIRPLGSDQNVKIDTRIICATHKDLKAKVLEGSFRKDLYYRINVLPIHIPCLKDRMEDFEDLLYGFGKQFGVCFSQYAIDQLKKYSWPGNIRELKNLVCKASALFPQKRIKEEDLKDLIDPFPEHHYPEQNKAPKKAVLSSVEKKMIFERLMFHKGNQKKTAEDLGIPASTLHDRLKKYKIDANDFKSFKGY